MKQYILLTLISLGLTLSAQASTGEQLITSADELWSQGKLAEAQAEFDKALEIDPQSSLVHARLANLYLAQNQTDQAIEAFQNAIILDARNARLFIGIAIAYLHKKHYGMAESMVNQAIAIDPVLANAHQLKTYIEAKKAHVSLNHSASDAHPQ